MFGKRITRALVVMATASLIMATAVFADQAEGDFAGGDTSADVTAGAAFSLNADLYIVRSGTAAATITWTGPTVLGSCAGISGTANPAGFTMPDPAWHNTDNNSKILSTTFDATKKSTVTISGTAGAVGGSCTLTYVASATTAASASGNAMPSGQRNVALTVNFVAPTVTNSAPVVAADNTAVTVDEGTEATMTGTWSDANAADNVTLSASVGTIQETPTGPGNSGTWSWSYTPDDGPGDSQTVTITANDNSGAANATSTATFSLVVDNVAPTASLTRVGPGNVLSGTTVTYNASATDPSSADATAGFTYSFNGGTFSNVSSLQRTYTTCGVNTESVRAQDKDNGISAPASASVSVFDGGFHGAIKPAMRNQVQKGRVIPVQIRLFCGDTAVTGLSPSIRLVTGELDPDTDYFSETAPVPTTVSAADTGGVMRSVDGGYIYNLQVPNVANTQYTILVRPWGTDGPTLTAVVETRK